MKIKTDSIKHLGQIEAIEGHTVRVRILQSSACAGCHAAGLCQSAESKEKVVEAHSLTPEGLQPGQQVVVEGSIRQGLQAVVYAYVLPIVLLVVTLVVCLAIGISESLSALMAIGVLVPYYFILYLLRARLSKRFAFEVLASQ